MENSNSSDMWSHSIHLLPSANEIAAAFLDIPISTIAIIVGVIFWLAILWIPLKGIDRRDTTASMMYGLFMCFCAAALFIVPKGQREDVTNYLGVIVTLIATFGAAIFRWLQLGDKQKNFQEILPEDLNK